MHAAIVSEISKLVAMLSSLEEVEQVLSDRGRPLDYKTIRMIAYRFATRARAAQRVGALNWGETVAGRRVVVSTDGGRIRIRTTKRGPKTAKGRNRYRTDWREPKLLIIYVVDEKGQMDREFLAVIDGTLGGPDAIFKLLEFYLRELKISTADKILFVADGARWIWNRVGVLLRRLGVKPDQVNELVDFYHAVEHLGKIAALQRRWTAAERQAWIGRQRRRLLKGGAEEVRGGDRCRVWFSPRQGVETDSPILQTERRKRSDGLRTDQAGYVQTILDFCGCPGRLPIEASRAQTAGRRPHWCATDAQPALSRPARCRWDTGSCATAWPTGCAAPSTGCRVAGSAATERRWKDQVDRRYAGAFQESNRRLAELTGLDLAASATIWI